jgi:hypothetical protein
MHLSAKMAVRLGRYFATGPEFWAEVQMQHDLAAKDAACQGGLKVVDIPAGPKPRLPATWPGVPLLIDSPDYPPAITGHEVSVRVPFANIGGIVGASYDGVTAALHINADLHAPLLCAADVFKVASGDLSLPGKVQ